MEEKEKNEENAGWLSRLAKGLNKSASVITVNINDLLKKRKLDVTTIDALEEILITADLGVTTATKLTNTIASSRFDQQVSSHEIRTALAQEITKILKPAEVSLEVNIANKPHVIIVCGVNGVGKTTTIGKLAQSYSRIGKHVMLAAGDTFRAAAIEQLKIWGERSNSTVIASEHGKDSASVAFESLEQAKLQNADILFVDTAGRLQNKTELMAELEKITRVINKVDQTAPHDCVLILDATTGQNAHSQVEMFSKMIDITGLIITKLDGTSKGGVLISLTEKYNIPIYAIGVGEGIEDLQPFEAKHFANSLMGLTE